MQQTYDNYSSLDSMFGFVQEKYEGNIKFIIMP